MTPIEKYLELEKKILDIRIKNGPSDSGEEENPILDEMDSVWWKEMSEEDHKTVDTPERNKVFWDELMKNPEWEQFFKDKTQKEKSQNELK